MKLLSIDPATTTGWCVLEFSPPGTLDDEEGSGMVCIQDYGYFTIDTSSEYEGDHCKNMQNRILDLIDKWNIDEVCLEDYFFSGKLSNEFSKFINYYQGILDINECGKYGLLNMNGSFFKKGTYDEIDEIQTKIDAIYKYFNDEI